MKDRLIFEKTKTNGISVGSSDCNGCDMRGNDKCGTTTESLIHCRKGFNFKLIEEEIKPVLSTYEHNKARYIILNSSCVFSHLSIADLEELEREKNMLRKWLEENKPENWQTCTKENTKVGDVVRVKACTKVFKNIEHIFMQRSCGTTENCVVNSIKPGSYPSILSVYEINIAEK